MNILVVTAHYDDLELGCGGTVAKLLEKGHQVFSLVMTHSGYRGPDNAIIRAKETALKEGRLASQVLGYELISFDEDTFDILVRDSNIAKILNVIHENEIDTVFTHWHGDTHPPHWRINKMVLQACRRVPRVLGFTVNWYIGSQSFNPNFFVSIDDSQWELKIKALKYHKSEFQRVGRNWVEYQNNQALCYGMQIGTKRAEGFFAYKYLWDILSAKI